ncbi:DUF294 nucleotidyltransferase-like domain-containing protein [Paenisporosarcina antarctica]|uniref:CBS domain-containing protein n=1 Tax=Paenisporosarcina antarctica TaxID=417367 RepID=A0A4V1AML6_9BACL|nr:DUF294 nucleotidyltransferase-like domain-containing protein [Paenisporosarcina antarctica]QBP39705.1 CBS domain-containing protein [Paenisporosarcina antarctica]
MEKTFRQPSNGKSIKDFVKNTPLFKGRNQLEFDQLYGRCEERQYDKGVLIANARKKRAGILLVTSGLAEVYAAGYQHEREVLELAGPGGIIGLASLSNMLKIQQKPPNTVEIQALETTLGLFLPYDVVKEMLEEHEIQRYFLEKVVFRLQDVYQSFTEQLQQSSFMDSQKKVFQRVQDMMSSPLLMLPPSSSMLDGIQFMYKEGLSAVVCLDSYSSQSLVVSMREIISAIAQEKPMTTKLLEIVGKESITIKRSAYYYEALSIFQKNPTLRHVIVVDEMEAPVGMLTLSDVLKQRHRSIQQVMANIDHLDETSVEEVSQKVKQVSSQLLEERESIRLIVSTMTPIYDEIVKKSIELAQQRLLKENGLTTPCEFVFYQMGSAGRGEQLLMTDQDHFLVYEKSTKAIDDYFKQLADEIVRLLEMVGFKRCDGDMMASNKIWRGSLADWQQRIHRWTINTTTQNTLYAYNFFAMRWVSGDRSLHHDFMNAINEELERSGILLLQMARELKGTIIPSLDHRILSFILREGKEIDLKLRVLFPFHHSLQLICLKNKIVDGSTFEKLESLRELNRFDDSTLEELKESADYVLMVTLQQKLLVGNSKVQIDKLTSREKALLSRALTVLREFQMTVLRDMGV